MGTECKENSKPSMKKGATDSFNDVKMFHEKVMVYNKAPMPMCCEDEENSMSYKED